MHEFSIDTSFFIGDPKGGQWSGVVVASEESQKVRELGRLFVVISLSAPKEFNSKVAGDFLLDNLQDVFYEDKGKDNVIGRLEKAILSTAKRLEYLLQREKVAAEEGIDLNITAVVVREEFIYMAVLGEGGVILFRGDALIDLTAGLKDLSGKDLIKSGSGKVHKQDKFILLSPKATLDISEQEIKTSVKRSSFSNMEGKKENSLLGVLMIGILPKGEEELSFEGIVSPKEEEPRVEMQEEVSDEKKDQEDKGPAKFEQDSSADLDKPGLEKSGLETESEYKDEDKDEEEKPIGGEKEGGQSPKDKVKEMGSKIKDKLADKTTYIVLLEKLKGLLLKVFLLFKTYIWEGVMGMGKKGLYIRGAAPKPSLRGIIILIAIVGALLYLSIRGIQRHNENSAKVAEARGILSEVSEKFENGRNLGEAGNIAEAVSILEEGMNQLEDVKSYGVLLEEVETKMSEGLGYLDEVRRVLVVTEDNIITDIAGYIEGGDANDITLGEDKLYISDGQNSAIYEVGFGGGEVVKVVGKETVLGQPDAIVFDSDGNLLISDLEKGILKLYPVEKRVEEITGLSVSSVGVVTEVDNYVTPDGSNFLYLLRAGESDVRKITRYPSGYSFPELRLPDSKLAEARDMEIDGKIYIITPTDGVLRYFVDNPDPYTIVGLDKSIKDSNCMELDDKLVYLGDSTLKRVIVLTKGSYLAPQQGRYVVQFEYRGEGDPFRDIREIIVDNDARLMFVLAGTKIFKLELTEVDQYAEKFE